MLFSSAKPSVSVLKTVNSLFKVIFVIIRPKFIREYKFRICKLPEKKIAYSKFSACSYKQFRVRNTCRIQIIGYCLLCYIIRRNFAVILPFRQPFYCSQKLIPAAVVKCYMEIKTCIVSCKVFKNFYFLLNIRIKS